jgi:L-malate glycosyltransferase
MPARPRIALVAASTEILGGQAVQASTLADALRGDGWDIRHVPTNPRFPRGLGWLRRVPYARTVLNEALYIASVGALRHADVVHVFTAAYWSFLMAVAPALVAGRLLGKRTVLNYHSGEAPDHLERFGPLVHPWLRLADTIVVPSEFLRGVFARHGYDARVVPNIVELDRFRWRPRPLLRPLLLSNRNLEPHYRVEDVVLAHALLLQRRPDARLDIAGTGSENDRLRRLARDRCGDSVRFLGRVEPGAMPGLYDRCDVFVNASVIDNQPLSVLEAFAAGLPVVSTPTGDIASMVRHGETGLLVAPRDPAALAGAIESLLDNRDGALAIAERARDDVRKYRWDAVRTGWEEVYAS